MAVQLSLLWPRGEQASNGRYWHENGIADLGLERIISALNIDGRHEKSIRAIFLNLCDDADTICYRQEIIEDLVRSPELAQHFHDLLPMLGDLAHYTTLSETEGLPFQKTVARLGELEVYIQIVQRMNSFLSDVALNSRGLLALRDTIRERLHDPSFERLRSELPGVMATIRGLASITVGINLDHNLKPVGLTLLSLNTESFKGSSFFKKLFGDRPEFQGISQLHTVPRQTAVASDGHRVNTYETIDPMLVPLFKDLDRLITDMIRPAAAALKNFLQISSQFLTRLEPEIAFYLGATRMINELTARGLPLCRVDVAPAEERVCVIRDCYNLNLALRTPRADLAAQIVVNDVNFDDNGRIFIITGANQGGKTTYLQAIGLAQVLFQAGLYIPGSSARISPVDGIYTHFPVEEKPNAEAGRFGEEAKRLSDIFTHITRYSLILLNESLASTAEGESLYLAQDIIRSFRLLGVRAAYTTHMHELAATLDALNSSTPGDSKAISLVAVSQVDPASGIKRTYKIVVSPPMGRSYANELAARYGISFDKIIETLIERRVLNPDAVDNLAS